MADSTARVSWADAVEPWRIAPGTTYRPTFASAFWRRRGRTVVDPAQLDDRHIVRRMIPKRVIFGVDKNPMAVGWPRSRCGCTPSRSVHRCRFSIITCARRCFVRRTVDKVLTSCARSVCCSRKTNWFDRGGHRQHEPDRRSDRCGHRRGAPIPASIRANRRGTRAAAQAAGFCRRCAGCPRTIRFGNAAGPIWRRGISGMSSM